MRLQRYSRKGTSVNGCTSVTECSACKPLVEGSNPSGPSLLDSLLAADDVQVFLGLFLELALDGHALFEEAHRFRIVFQLVIAPAEIAEDACGGLIAVPQHRQRSPQFRVGLPKTLLIDVDVPHHPVRRAATNTFPLFP